MSINIKTVCLGATFTFALTACDLNTSPTTSLDSNAVYSTSTNAERVLKGVWNYIFENSYHVASPGLGSIYLNDDFAGSDALKGKSYGFADSYNLVNGYGRGVYDQLLWDIAYDGINGSNDIIKNIDAVGGDDADKQRIKGQAYATRGFLYTLLASHYSFAIDKDPNAVCVPIYTEPTENPEQALTGKPASSVKEVYDQAISDLKEALKLIPSDYSHGSAPTDQYKIDYVVAEGLLARASLYSRNWKDAYDYAGAVLQANDYLMNEKEYSSGFNDYNNQEWLWSFVPTMDDNWPSTIFDFRDATDNKNCYNSLCVDPYFLNYFEKGDYRADLLGTSYGTILQGGKEIYLRNKKFINYDVANEQSDIDLMRTSEMYLIKAEAAARLGLEPEARQLLQKLRDARMKSGKAATVTASGDALIKEIWLERRKELWGEGFALTDLIRNQQSLERHLTNKTVTIGGKEQPVKGHYTTSFPDGSAFVPNSKYYLYRIPESEELQNTELYSKYPKLDIYR